jgi:hypothetical protein
MRPRYFQKVEFAAHIITERQDERKRSHGVGLRRIGPPPSRILNHMGEIVVGKHQKIVHYSSLIVHLLFCNGAASAMTNEQSTMNNEQ